MQSLCLYFAGLMLLQLILHSIRFVFSLPTTQSSFGFILDLAKWNWLKCLQKMIKLQRKIAVVAFYKLLKWQFKDMPMCRWFWMQYWLILHYLGQDFQALKSNSIRFQLHLDTMDKKFNCICVVFNDEIWFYSDFRHFQLLVTDDQLNVVLKIFIRRSDYLSGPSLCAD